MPTDRFPGAEMAEPRLPRRLRNLFSRSRGDPKRTAGDRKEEFFGPWLKATPAVGVVLCLAYSVVGNFNGGSTFWSVLATGTMATAATLMVGAFIGFLFGMPRAVERTAQTPVTALLTTNTNLEQISDWLTKILVGLGLVQLGKVAGGIDSLATSLMPGLGDRPEAHAFATGLLVYSAVDGFLIGYLWTRIVVSVRLREAAEDLLSNSVVADSPPPSIPPPLPPPPPGVDPEGADPEGTDPEGADPEGADPEGADPDNI